MTTIEDIFSEDPLVLADTNIEFAEDPSWYKKSVWPAKKFSQLNPYLLDGVSKSLAIATDMYSQGLFYTVSKVVDEKQRFTDIISDKLSALSARQKKSLVKPSRIGNPVVHRKARRRKSNWRKPSEFDDCTDGKAALERVSSEYELMIRKMKRRLFKAKNIIIYNALEELAVDITQAVPAKRDYRQDIVFSKQKDLNTDESLVAHALYSSVVDERKCNLVSNDSDLKRILSSSLSVIYKSKNPQLIGMKEAIHKNPIKIYSARDVTDVELRFNTEGTEYLNHDFLDNLSEKGLKTITKNFGRRLSMKP